MQYYNRILFGNGILIALLAILAGAFHSRLPIRSRDHIHKQQGNNRQAITGFSIGNSSTQLNGWFRDALDSLFGNLFQSSKSTSNEKNEASTFGTVVRTASKEYNQDQCSPQSSLYTTKKHSQLGINVNPQGVDGDYNHYRTMALSSTPDRAVSILTTDILQMLREDKAGWPQVRDGDLGENIYVNGIPYTFFQVGQRYEFSSSSSQGKNDKQQGAAAADNNNKVIVEITERIEPCGNLCKLDFINIPNISVKERMEKCKAFLTWLDEKDGLRGWYGKVIGDGGTVQVGDTVSLAVVT